MIKEGFASLSEKEQLRVIRSIYPNVSELEQILTNLFLKGAVDENTAISLPESQPLAKLIEAEHIARTDGMKYYLTTDAQMIAKGALSTYPELARLD